MTQEHELVRELEKYYDAVRLVIDCTRPVKPHRFTDGVIISKEAYYALIEAYYGL